MHHHIVGLVYVQESEVNEDYIDVGSMAATIAKMRQETPPVSPTRLQNSVGLYNQIS